MSPLKLVVLASGRGSNFSAIAAAISDGRLPGCELVGLVCNKPGAPVVDLARERGVPTHIVDFARFKPDRDAYERKLLEVLRALAPDVVCLAGYMLLLGTPLIDAYRQRMINIHPSLLPAFKGLRAQKQALDAGAQRTGCTVHFVTEEMDSGEIIAQREIAILPGDTEESLSRRLLPLEHATYVEALQKLSARRAADQ